jgi:hypothetical protein
MTKMNAAAKKIGKMTVAAKMKRMKNVVDAKMRRRRNDTAASVMMMTNINRLYLES